MNPHATRQFGVDLNDVMLRGTETVVPTIVKEMVLFLNNCTEVPGIFRITPNSEFLRIAFSDVNYKNCDFSFDRYSPHVVASLFKKYLDDLPTGLIPTRMYYLFLSTKGNLKQLREIIMKQLPPINKRLLEILCVLLFMVGEKASSNQMETSELAVIFAPLVLRKPHSDTSNNAVENMLAVFVLQMMIENHVVLFRPRRKDMTMVKSTPPPNLVACRKNVQTIDNQITQLTPVLAHQLKNLKNSLENLDAADDLNEVKDAVVSAKQEFAKYAWTLRVTEKKSFVPYVLKSITRVKSDEHGIIGRRNTMEDQVILFDDLNAESSLLSLDINRSMYAVYDGHAGSEVSTLAKEHLHKDIIRYLVASTSTNKSHVFDSIRKGIKKTDTLIGQRSAIEGFKSGSTMVLVYIQEETLFVANLGDSEAVLGRRIPGTQKYTPILLSRKHKPEDGDELDRLLSLGAIVVKQRLFGLAVSRSLGDNAYKKPSAKHDFVSNDPYLASLELQPTDDFLVIACDGLWDCVTYQDAVDIAGEERDKGTEPKEVARKLVDTSYNRESSDNISVIVVYFNWKAA